MKSAKIKEAMNKEVEEIKSLMLKQVDEHIQFLSDKFDSSSSLLELELQIRKDINDYGRILLEKFIPFIYGYGYYGSNVEEYDEETEENTHFSCVLKTQCRSLKSIFGDITITRAYYQNDEDGTSLGLLDKKLDIHKYKVSPAMRYYSNLLGITTSYCEGEKLFEKFFAVKMCAKNIDQFTQSKARIVADDMASRIENIELDSNNRISPADIKAKDDCSKVIYLETDGCHVPIRKRRGRRDWKECKTLLLFEVEKVEVNRNGKIIIENKLRNKRYFSCVEDIAYFKKQVKCELEKYCKDQKVKIVCVGDGAQWIWKMTKELIPEGKVEILDWYHVKEKITILAAELYPDDKNETDKELFVDDMAGYFYNGEFDRGIAGLEETYTKTKSRELQAKITLVMEYFKNNQKRMNYSEYVKEGFCIGSGAIESANKYVIQRRMKLPGCSWIHEFADNMAHMRAEFINGNFDKIYALVRNPMLTAT